MNLWHTKFKFQSSGIIVACLISLTANAQQQSQNSPKNQNNSQNSGQGSGQSPRQKSGGGSQKKQSSTQQRGKLNAPPRLNEKSQAYSTQDTQDPDTASSRDVRQFHEVLNDLLSEFAYDVKQGQIDGLKNISIRRVDISDTLPRTYEPYTELLVTERIRENSKIKIINCVPCKSKSSTMIDGKLMISSPLTNVQKMDEAANQLGIENFMDVVLVYHTTHMVLAFNVFNTQTKEMTWARTFNSETLRSRYQRLAVDRNQIEKSRTSDVYVPDYKFLVGLGASQLPNVAGTARDKSFIGFHLRAVEKFDNRRTDFGLYTSIFANTAKFLKAYPSEGAASGVDEVAYSGSARALPYKYVLSLHATVARNFIGDLEMYDRIRHGVHFGLGAVISSGYLAPSVRAGWDLYFGRRFVVTLGGQYITSSVVLVKTSYSKVRGGGGGDFILSYNF